jgi:hypothetical protein
MPFRNLIRFENLHTGKTVKEPIRIELVGENEVLESKFFKSGFQYISLKDSVYFLKVIYKEDSRMSYQTIIKVNSKKPITIKIL